MRNSAQTHPADGPDLDALSRRFEAALLEEDPPRIEQYLAQVPEPQQPAAFHRLLALEVEYLTDRDDTTAVEAYLDRFPQYAETVREVFDAVDQDQDDTEIEPEPEEPVEDEPEADVAAPNSETPVDVEPVRDMSHDTIDDNPAAPERADAPPAYEPPVDVEPPMRGETLQELPQRETVVEPELAAPAESDVEIVEDADEAEALEAPTAEPESTYAIPGDVRGGSGRGMLVGVVAAAVVAIGLSAWGLWQLVMQPDADADASPAAVASEEPTTPALDPPAEPTPDAGSQAAPSEDVEEPMPRTAQRPSTAEQAAASERAEPEPRTTAPPTDPANDPSTSPPSDAERSAEIALLQAGGLVSLDGQQHVRMVHISGRPLGEETVAHLRALPQIAELFAADCELGDAHLDVIAGLTSLVRLDLAGNPITDAGLAKLTSLPNLRTLNVAGTQVTEAGVSQLQQALPNLSIQR